MNNPINQPYLQCERLDVYRVALEFHRSIMPLKHARGIADLRDQLLRASESVVLNIAEGAGREGVGSALLTSALAGIAVVERSVHLARLVPNQFHDVNLAAVRPSAIGLVGRQQPNRRP